MSTLRDCLQELVARRYTQTEIAAAAEVTQPTISRVMAGSDIGYEAGKRIEQFFERERANDFRRAGVVAGEAEGAAA